MAPRMDFNEIAVGIDFGTSYSGVAYMGSKYSSPAVIDDWPSAPSGKSFKVPTLIKYHPTDPEQNTWGYEAQDPFPEAPEVQPLGWFKLLLDDHPKQDFYYDYMESEQVKKFRKNCGDRTPGDVTADYLGYLWRYANENIKDRTRNHKIVKVVLSVPAIWSDRALEVMRTAAVKAGIPEQLVSFIHEPEAGAIASLIEMANEDGIGVRRGEKFVICDAGGGTVDVISYSVKQSEPLGLDECVVGNGNLCGSVQLDIAFENYVKKLIGEQIYNDLPPANIQHMLEKWETMIKRKFTENKAYSVPDPRSVSGERLQLKPAELKKLFDQLMSKIGALVHAQVKMLPKNDKITILLLGGFGESGYLGRYLQHTLKTLTVKHNRGSWSAICRGAAIRAGEVWMANDAVPGPVPATTRTFLRGHGYRGGGPPNRVNIESRKARLSYGIAHNRVRGGGESIMHMPPIPKHMRPSLSRTRTSQFLHSPTQSIRRPSSSESTLNAPNDGSGRHVQWFIRQNESIDSVGPKRISTARKVSVKFLRNGYSYDTIVSTAVEKPELALAENINEVYSLKWTLPTSKRLRGWLKGGAGVDFNYDLGIQIKPGIFTCTLIHQDKRLRDVKVEVENITMQ